MGKTIKKKPNTKEQTRILAPGCFWIAITEVVYHLTTKSGNFGWIVNGKSNFVAPNANFLRKTKGRPNLTNGISKWKMCVPFASFYWFQVV